MSFAKAELFFDRRRFKTIRERIHAEDSIPFDGGSSEIYVTSKNVAFNKFSFVKYLNGRERRGATGRYSFAASMRHGVPGISRNTAVTGEGGEPVDNLREALSGRLLMQRSVHCSPEPSTEGFRTLLYPLGCPLSSRRRNVIVTLLCNKERDVGVHFRGPLSASEKLAC